MDPQKRRLSVILLAGAALLIVAIFVGKAMGDRVMTHVTEQGQTGVGSALLLSPAPAPSDVSPYGPNWKRTQVLAAATDPGFPDPRVPPAALPSAAPTPKATPRPKATAKPTPVANPTFTVAPAPMPSPSPSGSPSPGASPAVTPSPQGSPAVGPPVPPR